MFKEEVLAPVLDAPAATSAYEESPIWAAHAKSDYELERNKPMPNLVHAVIQNNLSKFLGVNYDDEFLFASELSLETTPGSTPDISIYPNRVVEIESVAAKESAPPLTTIEIVSPSQTVDEMIRKVREIYFPMGVKSAWIVVPELRTISIQYPDKTRQTFAEGMVADKATGIQIPLEQVFRKLT